MLKSGAVADELASRTSARPEPGTSRAVEHGNFPSLVPDHLSIDIRALAAFRIGLGLLLLTDLVLRLRHLVVHYTDAGVLPRAALLELRETFRFSLHMMSGEAWFQAMLFGVAAVCAVALLLGVRTRAATIASWLLLASLHARNPHLLQAGDTLLRLFLFWGIFLPLGAAFSVDRVLARSDSRPATRVRTVPAVALLVQVILVYLTTALYKLHPTWVPEGRAVQHALQLEHYTTPMGVWLLNFPESLRVATYGTLLLEFVAPLLLFAPFAAARVRVPLVATFIAFHASFVVFMKLGLFPWISMLGWIVFLPTSFWDGLLSRRIGATSSRRSFDWANTSRARTLASKVARMIPGRGDGWRTAPAMEIVALFLMGYVAAWNIAGMGPGRRLPDSVRWVGHALALEQRWTMFAPYPLRTSGRVDVRGITADGRVVSLAPTVRGPLATAHAPTAGHSPYAAPAPTRGDAPPPASWQVGASEVVGVSQRVGASERGGFSGVLAPESSIGPYFGYRWRKYQERVRQIDGLRGPYARRICDGWTRHHPDGPRLERVVLTHVYRFTSPVTHTSGEVMRHVLHEEECG